MAGCRRDPQWTPMAKERILQRADCFATREDAAAFTIVKGKQVIDQRGDELFADGGPAGPEVTGRHLIQT